MLNSLRRLFQPEAPALPGGEDWKKLGNEALAQGRLAQAAHCYRNAVTADPRDAAACLNLGYALGEAGQAEEAIEWLRRATELDPSQRDAHFLMARQLRAAGELDGAEQSFARAVDIDPGFDLALREQGEVLLALGDAPRARDVLARLARLRPEDPSAQAHWGLACESAGDTKQAEACYRRALALEPLQAQSLFGLANVLFHHGDSAGAADLYARVLEQLPDHAGARTNLAQAQLAMGRYAEAEQSWRSLLSVRPDDPLAGSGHANALLALQRHEEALDAYDRLLALHPDHAQGHLNRGNALNELGRRDEALESFQRALAARPGYVDALVNIGSWLQAGARYAEAVPLHRQAIAQDPASAAAHWNLAVCLMMLGEWQEGWREAEWRWQVGGKAVPNLGAPLWTGEQDLRGRRILVHSEQGLGDTIQFSRYIPALAARGAHVIFSAQGALHGLLRGLDPRVTLMENLPLPGRYDLHCPLLSLPLAFRTGPETVPAPVPYLRGDPALRDRWREQLRPDGRLQVGIVWSGNPRQADDRRRSMPLSTLADLAMDGVRLVSLQKEVRASDREVLENGPFDHFGDQLRDFSDTAALAECMDLVISVCTSVAHLCGALGRPTWVLLSSNPDWRWMAAGDTSAWYPTARLFRQPSAGDWPSVVAEVRRALDERRAVRQDPVDAC